MEAKEFVFTFCVAFFVGVIIIAAVTGGPIREDLGTVTILTVEDGGSLSCWAVRMEGTGINPDSLYKVWWRNSPITKGDRFRLVRKWLQGYTLVTPRDAEK